MPRNMQEILKVYKDAQKDQKILRGVVKMVYFDETLGTDVLALDLDGMRGIIVKEEVDSEIELKSLVNFLGREINFVVIAVDKAEIYCSRAKAQQLQKEDTMKRILNYEEVEGQIINILEFGAYVDVNGVSGLLKNIYFAEDYTTVKDIHSFGDRIKVRLKKISENGNLVFEAVEKYTAPTIIDISKLSRDQVILGVIRDIKPSGEVFVQIGPNLDALCGVPFEGELEEDKFVQVKLTKVDLEKNRVRGKILKVL